MRNSLLTGWTFTRVLYVAIGLLVMIQAVMQQQWLGILFGSYFASMGIFAFGCAAGNCSVAKRNTSPIQNKKAKN